MCVVVSLVSSKAKLSGKAAKKLEKKIRRAEREKEEFNHPKPTPTQQKATTTPSNTNADATPSTTTDDSEMKPVAPAATSAKKKKATKTINTDAMDVDELIADKPRVAEIRRSRKSKAAPMNVD